MDADCYAKIKASFQSYTLDVTKQAAFDMAFDKGGVPCLSMVVPSGGILTSPLRPTSTITIRPVGDNRMRDAFNRVAWSRSTSALQANDVGLSSYLTYPQTLLSVAFECLVEPDAVVPFTIAATVTAQIDLNMQPVWTDVCLARIWTVPALDFKAWRCLIESPDARRLSYNAANTTLAPPTTAMVLSQVHGVFSACGKGNSSAAEGEIYGFIYNPIKIYTPPFSESSFIRDYLLYILLGLFFALVLGMGAVYWMFRLYRYRKKYHTERDNVKTMTEEVEEMEQFGGKAGTKDDEVQMISNPLVLQMKDMQARLDKNQMELRRQENVESKAQVELRKEHINALQTDRDKLMAELERLKGELAISGGTSAPTINTQLDIGSMARGDSMMGGTVRTNTMDMTGKSLATTRSEFQAGAPGRKKKDF